MCYAKEKGTYAKSTHWTHAARQVAAVVVQNKFIQDRLYYIDILIVPLGTGRREGCTARVLFSALLSYELGRELDKSSIQYARPMYEWP